MNRIPYLLPIFALLLTLSSCGPQYLYENEQAFDTGQWTYQDSLVNTFTISDTFALYNLHLFLDHGVNFPAQNTYVRLHTTFPDGQRMTREVSLELAAKDGAWYGDCSRERCSLDIPIQQGAYFNQAGEYRITIEQFSRQNPLPEVYRIGFALEATGEQRR